MVAPVNTGQRDLGALLRALAPARQDGIYAYCVVPHGTDTRALAAVVTVAEPEGLTLVLPEDVAIRAGLTIVFRAAWIRLTVHSDLQAVGLTAAVSAALSAAGISCNVVAGAYHDHLFVPIDLASQALVTLEALSARQGPA